MLKTIMLLLPILSRSTAAFSSESEVALKRAYGEHTNGQMHFRIAQPKAAEHNPLVCVHMSPSSGSIFDTLLREMGLDRIAIAPDTPGFGDFDPPDNPPEIADFARANFSLLDQLDIT